MIAGNHLPKKFPGKYVYHQLFIMDFITQDLFPSFHEAIEFIDSADKILVHCAVGVSRSVSMVIAYLIIKKNMSYDEALKLVKEKRKVAFPNPAFVR